MVIEKAYAKINLSLKVTGRRPDGYHDLESIMLPLELHDTLTFEHIATDEIIIVDDTSIVDNIIVKTAQYLKGKYHVTKGAKISLLKDIPLSAGLAGGSADCAATLRGLNRLWNLQLSDDALFEAAKDLGSDTMFCLFNRPALVQGRGERLTFLPLKYSYHVLLVNPGYGVSTKVVFQHTESYSLPSEDFDDVIQAFNQGDLITLSKKLVNDLSEVTYSLHPDLIHLLNVLKDFSCITLMSGSGPTHYAFFLDESSMDQARLAFNDHFLTIKTLIIND